MNIALAPSKPMIPRRKHARFYDKAILRDSAELINRLNAKEAGVPSRSIRLFELRIRA